MMRHDDVSCAKGKSREFFEAGSGERQCHNTYSYVEGGVSDGEFHGPGRRRSIYDTYSN